MDLYADNDFEDDCLLEDDEHLEVESDTDGLDDKDYIQSTSKMPKSRRIALDKSRLTVINIQAEDD